MRIPVACLAAIVLFGTSNGFAAVVGYWQFNDRASGETASVVISQVNSPSLNGTASGFSGGAAPKFSEDVPGTRITDGLGGPVITDANATSLRFVNSGSVDSHTGGRVSVADTSSLLQLRDFTIEAFIKIDRHTNYPTIIGKSRVDTNGPTWLLDTSNNGTLRARVDSQPLGQTSGNGWNQGISTSLNLEDGLWHHVAATYLDSTKRFTLFVDYVQRGQATTSNPIVYDGSPLLIGQGGGGRAFDGWIDEVRYSSGVLAPDQFLRASLPEPSTLAMAALALLGLGLFGWRRKGAIEG